MKKRTLSFIAIFVIYMMATVLGIAVFILLPGKTVLFKLFIADVAATIFVWFFGMVMKNSSVYDPYWSYTPLVIVIGLVVHYQTWNLGNILLIAVIALWSIRLTGNWAYTFKGIDHQDWRYTKYKTENNRFWFFINLFGINLMPTLVVFVAMIPVLYYVREYSYFNIYQVLALLLSLAAISLELISDVQLHRFRKTASPGDIMTHGLWRYSRHPNYLGEILMWWGIYLLLVAVNPEYWYLFVCPSVNTLLFLFISIPLMEKRLLANKPGYAKYRQQTSLLLLLPSKESLDEAEELLKA